jgi:glycosyltransferase involved in cell wall biosynthesis
MVGGTEMQTLHLVKALVSLKFQVKVICYFEYELEMVKLFEAEGISVGLLNYPRTLGFFEFIREFKKYLKSQMLDIFHVQYMAPGALPIIAAKLAGVRKILATVHQPHTPSHGRFSKLILNVSSKLCHAFIAVSKSAEESWFGSSHLLDFNVNYLGLPNHFTIYNSVNTRLIQEIALSRESDMFPRALGDANVVIGTVARLSSVKGVDILIKAFEQVLKTHQNCELWIVGDGEEKESLLTLTENLSLSNKIVFLGKNEWSQTIKILSKMDIVVLASRFEAFGLAAAEALVLAKPVIASDTFGLKEVIQHEKTGLTFPVSDSSALAYSIIRLINDPNFAKKIAENGAIDIQSRFDYAIFNSQINLVYSHITKDLAA